ncbi:universal stress protein [Reticulibacter mediterranei]|uniref:universal stress protein n=1 Tax=Reticulibacter mediterranei TaxID=2778369 RepID=UPI001C69022F|nr:universal stress protein [Reticulibacter mediterranei]
MTGDIAVVLCDNKLDTNLIYLGCQMARSAKRKVHLIRVLEVPRALPLKAVLTQESDRAERLLHAAMEIAEKFGCEAVCEVVQARDAGPAIVDEASDHQCALILIGLIRTNNKPVQGLGKTVQHVLTYALCRVWLIQDPAPRPQPIAEQKSSFKGSKETTVCTYNHHFSP